MSRRTCISLGVCILGLLLPAAAQAAGARVRVLNAAPSGTVTLRVDGVAKATRLGVRRESARFAVGAGRHTFSVVRGTRTVVRRTIAVAGGQRMTIVYAENRGRPELRLLREPAPVAGAAQLWVANYAVAAGAVDVRIGAQPVAAGLRYATTTVPHRLTAAFSPVGLATVTARTGAGVVVAAAQPLVLATRSVGLFVLVPRGTGAQLLRLAYDAAPPTPARQPAVTGTRRVGNAVRCERDTWTPKGVSVRRLWSVDGVAAGAAEALTLTAAAHAGRTIGCTVTATANGMTTTVRTSFALPQAPTMRSQPFVEFPAGALGPGDILTCNPGTWTPATTELAIRWIRIGSGVQIGTGPTYTLRVPDDNGIVNSLGCTVVATTDGGAAATVRSSNTIALGIAPTVAIVPSTRPGDLTESRDAFFQWTIGGGGADTVECSLDGSPFVACIGQFAQTYHLPAPGSAGAGHTFVVRATNVVASVTDTDAWTIVPPAPTVTLGTAVPGNPTTDTTASFSWTLGGGAATLACDLDGAPVACSGTGVMLTLPDPGINGDSHTFTVSVANAKPATDSESYTWLVRPPDPDVSALEVNPIGGSTTGAFFLTFVVTGPTTSVTCELDGLPPIVDPCTSPQPFDDPGAGPHKIIVRASNPFGVDAEQIDWVYEP